MQKLQLLGISIFSGILLWASWPTSPLTFLIFIAFVPLLFVADAIEKRTYFFVHSFVALLIWNTLTTWWIWNSTDVGSIAAIIANSLLMCMPWWGYHVFKSKFGKRVGYCSLIACWMLFEYIHLNWQLSWPWLSLGNVFASKTNWIQWYEFTGIGGGTLWVLVVNILVHDGIKKIRTASVAFKVKRLLLIASLFIFPFFLSLVLYLQMAQKPVKKNNVVIVQPNIDPYQKFESNSTAQQIQTLIFLSEQKIDSSTKLVLWPETALASNVAIDEVEKAIIYQPVFDFVNSHPNITLLTGIETYKMLGTQKTTASARKTADGQYYDSYNAAVSIKAHEPLQFYIKSKLVPGVESLPTFLNFLGPVFEQFGGTTGGYGKDDEAKIFINTNNPFIPAPVICYESIYGEYVASYVAKGANLIAIITNDGWWGNTPGHKQHLAYAKLRAIETRRWVARSANTGISAVIDNYGDVKMSTAWNKADAIKFDIPIKTGQTFYVKHGDYLYKIFSVFALLIIGWNLIMWMKKKTQRK